MKQSDIDELLAYLDKRKTSYNSKDVCTFYIKAHKTLESLITENEKLKQRLEISDDHNIDGITSRNATIRLLEMDKEKLTTKCEALELLIIDLNKKRVELSE